MPKCPICGKNKSNKEDMINHVENEHINEIPENMSTAQFIYYKIHGREYGLCRICNKPTPWNEKAGKPSQICGSPSCKAKIREIAQQRMLKVYGKTSLMNDMEHQEKMLAHRKISGTYIWSDKKHKFTYTGKYEKFAIEWLDKVMDLNPDKIQMPGPVLPYEFNGEIKYWITDIFLEDFNLIIEIKAGKDENTHPGFEHNRELEDAKDLSMQKQNEFNYIKITHKSMMNLIKVLSLIRMNNMIIDKKDVSPIISINENISNESETKMYNSNLSNKDILSLCESIIEEQGMSIANLNPIVTSVSKDTNKFSLYQRLQNIKDKLVKKESKNESNEDPQDNMFSPNNTKDSPDPLVTSNNFTENEEVIVDIETDPYDTRPNDFAELSRSNTKSYFN